MGAKDVRSMALCQTQNKGNIVAWEKSSLLNNNAIMKDISDTSYFCNTSTRYVIFPHRMRSLEGELTCWGHGGEVAVPNSDEETQEILDLVSKHKRKCMENSNSLTGAQKIC